MQVILDIATGPYAIVFGRKLWNKKARCHTHLLEMDGRTAIFEDLDDATVMIRESLELGLQGAVVFTDPDHVLEEPWRYIYVKVGGHREDGKVIWECREAEPL